MSGVFRWMNSCWATLTCCIDTRNLSSSLLSLELSIFTCSILEPRSASSVCRADRRRSSIPSSAWTEFLILKSSSIRDLISGPERWSKSINPRTRLAVSALSIPPLNGSPEKRSQYSARGAMTRQRRVASTRVRILTVLSQKQKPSDSLTRSFEPLILHTNIKVNIRNTLVWGAFVALEKGARGSGLLELRSGVARGWLGQK